MDYMSIEPLDKDALMPVWAYVCASDRSMCATHQPMG